MLNDPELADVVIVGAGVAGSLIAFKLASANLKVVILESGTTVDRDVAVSRFKNAIAKTPESAYEDLWWAPRPTTLDPGAYYVQDGPDTFSATYERKVGGTTWHWLGTALRLLPNDFRMASSYRVGINWPLSYADLSPWYDQAEMTLGVSGDAGANLGGAPRNGPYPMKPIDQSYLDSRVKAAVASLGLVVAPTPQARNSEPFDGRRACCGNASCIPVCPIRAKYDGSIHANKAQSAGAQLIEKAVATFIEVNADGRIASIQYKHPDGTSGRFSAKVYVLAAHAIETPKLLLISRTDALPGGVANSSDQVGRNLSDHPTQLSWALTKDPVYPYRGPLSTSGIENLRDGKFRRSRSAFRIEIGNDGWSWPFGWPTASAGVLINQGLQGRVLQQRLNEDMKRHIRFASLTEQLPDPDNRITPSWADLDSFGIPRPRIQFRVNQYSLAGLSAARQVHDKMFDAIGVTFRSHSEVFQSAGHIMGTYRMGRDPKRSVADVNGRSHDHENLYLAGSGLFPTIGTANPTLTLVALALKTAEAIKKELQA